MKLTKPGELRSFAAYPRCSADGALEEIHVFRVGGGAPSDELRIDGYGVWARLRRLRITGHGSPTTDRRRLRIAGLGGEARLDRLRIAAMCSVGIAGGALVRDHRCSVATERPRQTGVATRPPPNKGMKLTKLSAAWFPEWTCRLMPAPTRSDAGTASQLIPGVRLTLEVMWRA